MTTTRMMSNLLLLLILVSSSIPSLAAPKWSVLASAVFFTGHGNREDPEVQICRQQCSRQWQFRREERRVCYWLCDEYGREKAEGQGEGGGVGREEIERQRERCNHQCRVAQLDGREEKVCRGKCEEQYREERRKVEEEERSGGHQMLRWVVQALHGRA